MKKGQVKGSGSMSNGISTLSHKIEEFEDKATVTITFDVKFPFKYMANDLVLKLMDIHFQFSDIANKFRSTPHHEIAEMLLEMRKEQKGEDDAEQSETE